MKNAWWVGVDRSLTPLRVFYGRPGPTSPAGRPRLVGQFGPERSGRAVKRNRNKLRRRRRRQRKNEEIAAPQALPGAETRNKPTLFCSVLFCSALFCAVLF
eukprot:gene23791-biopygen19362